MAVVGQPSRAGYSATWPTDRPRLRASCRCSSGLCTSASRTKINARRVLGGMRVSRWWLIACERLDLPCLFVRCWTHRLEEPLGVGSRVLVGGIEADAPVGPSALTGWGEPGSRETGPERGPRRPGRVRGRGARARVPGERPVATGEYYRPGTNGLSPIRGWRRTALRRSADPMDGQRKSGVDA